MFDVVGKLRIGPQVLVSSAAFPEAIDVSSVACHDFCRMPPRDRPAQLDERTKLARVREAMSLGDWATAIKLAAKFQALGRHGVPIRRARDALNNPGMYGQLGYDVDGVMADAVAALKQRFSRSWAAATGAPSSRTSGRKRRRQD